MPVTRLLCLLGSAAAAAARDKDAYVADWARAGSAARCDAPDCEWMARFPAIDVGCRIIIDNVGLTSGSMPAFRVEFDDGRSIKLDARNATNPFSTRPALCEYTTTTPKQGVALLMVANAPRYLFRLWPQFLNKLLYASENSLRPFLWLGEIPYLRPNEQCLASREMRHITGHRRLARSYYDGAEDPTRPSNHYAKMPAALATLDAPGVEGLYYVDLDAVARYPFTRPDLAEHLDRQSDISFRWNYAESGPESRLRWQVKGSRFYVRDSAEGRGFMSAWFHNRCTFKDQYALWHTILKLASRFGCLEYDNDILRMKYWDVKDLKAERTSLLLDCSIIERKCPLFPYARPCAQTPPDLLDAVYHHTMRRGATFDTGSLVVENACFEKRVRTVPPCESPSSLSTYAAWLGLDALSEAHGWTGRPDLERYPSTRDALKESDCGSPACRRAARWGRQPRLGDGCAHVFLDVGANVGLHGRFLYEPELYPDNRYHDVFPEVFGANWRTDKGSMCVVAFEPNPRHRAWLTRQAVAYQRRGWRYVAVFAAVGAGASDAKLTFVRPEKGSSNNDWGFSVEWGGASHESGERVEVPFVDLAGFVHHHVGRRAPDQRVLMKMDIEGVELSRNQDFTARSSSTPSTRRLLDGVAVPVRHRCAPDALVDFHTGVEYLVLPSLLKTGASRSLDMVTLEKHRAKKVCPLHFLDVVVSHAQCKAMGRAWKGQFEGCGTRLLYLDDESYASDEAKPLPE